MDSRILISGLISFAILPVAALGARVGIWSLPVGLGSLIIAYILALITLIPGITILFIMLRRKYEIFDPDLSDMKPLLLATLPSLLVSVYMTQVVLSGRGLPAIHNISTDLVNPPAFVKIKDIRAEGDNPLAYKHPDPDQDIAKVQRATWPHLRPLLTTSNPEVTFDKALKLISALGWELVHQDAEAGIIEATDTSFWFGFKDDIIIRIRGVRSGSRVDLRSVSRVGLADLGVNAERIHTFLREWEDS